MAVFRDDRNRYGTDRFIPDKNVKPKINKKSAEMMRDRDKVPRVSL